MGAAVGRGTENASWSLAQGWAWARLGDVAVVNPQTSFDALSQNAELPFVPMASVAE
jgi:hypothetical protein